MEIIKLKEIIKGKGSCRGFEYKKVYENEKWYIYQMIIPSGEKRKLYFEVFRKKLQHPLIMGSKIFEKDKTKWIEQYPGDSAFGVWAWGVNSIARAMRIIAEKDAV